MKFSRSSTCVRQPESKFERECKEDTKCLKPGSQLP
uniref:Uncharacterized protein n=1 Tax=Rhizophora mucronata TaxID=61149 RepID=A0A2P2R4Q5_RHIMU